MTANRVLLVAPRPIDQAPLPLIPDLEPMRRAFASVGARVDIHLRGLRTYSGLVSQLRASRGPVDVLHFDGHARRDSQSVPELLFESDIDAGVHPVRFSELVLGLGQRAHSHQPILIVLSACEAFPPQSALAGLDALNVAGVIGFDTSISSSDGMRLVQHLYELLGAGQSVAEALVDHIGLLRAAGATTGHMRTWVSERHRAWSPIRARSSGGLARGGGVRIVSEDQRLPMPGPLQLTSQSHQLALRNLVAFLMSPSTRHSTCTVVGQLGAGRHTIVRHAAWRAAARFHRVAYVDVPRNAEPWSRDGLVTALLTQLRLSIPPTEEARLRKLRKNLRNRQTLMIVDQLSSQQRLDPLATAILTEEIPDGSRVVVVSDTSIAGTHAIELVAGSENLSSSGSETSPTPISRAGEHLAWALLALPEGPIAEHDILLVEEASVDPLRRAASSASRASALGELVRAGVLSPRPELLRPRAFEGRSSGRAPDQQSFYEINRGHFALQKTTVITASPKIQLKALQTFTAARGASAAGAMVSWCRRHLSEARLGASSEVIAVALEDVVRIAAPDWKKADRFLELARGFSTVAAWWVRAEGWIQAFGSHLDASQNALLGGDAGFAQAEADTAMSLLPQLQDTPLFARLSARAYIALGEALRRGGNLRRAHEIFQEVESRIEVATFEAGPEVRSEWRRDLSTAYRSHAEVRRELGDFGKPLAHGAARLLLDAAKIARGNRRLHIETDLLEWLLAIDRLAYLAELRGQWSRAKRRYAIVRSRMDEVAPDRVPLVIKSLGDVTAREGKGVRASRFYDEAAAVAERVSDSGTVAFVLARQARELTRDSRHEEARDRIRDILRTLERDGGPGRFRRVQTLLELAEASGRVGEYSLAEELIAESLTAVGVNPGPSAQADIERSRALILKSQAAAGLGSSKRWTSAALAFRHAAAGYWRGQAHWRLWRCRLHAADCYAARGDDKRARRIYQAAAVAFERMGDTRRSELALELCENVAAMDVSRQTGRTLPPERRTRGTLMPNVGLPPKRPIS